MHTRDDPATQLRRQLARVESATDSVTLDTIRATLWEWVDEAKRSGWAPEQVLVAVKRIARDAGLRPSVRVALTLPIIGTATDALLADIVRWCIERYYAGAPQRPDRLSGSAGQSAP